MNAKIRIIRSNSSFDIEYTYIVPDEMRGDAHVGVFVDVPFGNSPKSLGLIVGLEEGDDHVQVGGKSMPLKPIGAINNAYRPLDEKQLELCDMMAERYVCGTAEACRLMMIKTREVSPKTVKAVRLKVSAEEALDYLKNRKSVKEGAFSAVKMLSENPEGVPEKTLITVCEISQGAIKRLRDDGIVDRFDGENIESETGTAAGNPEGIQEPSSTRPEVVLNKGQQEAFDRLSELLFSGKFSEFLLRGVTGSGKTEVYFKLMGQALEKGFGAILLVPEIVLTEQMIKRVRKAFGEGVAVLHSRMTDKKRAEEYARIEKGEARIVLGVRSAVFAPVRNLKLIILDEEQEPSFKSFDARPYYHAGEVAAMRLLQEKGLLVYGSATPRVTTFHRAVSGEIGYAFLRERAFAQSMPEVIIVDMKKEAASGNNSPVSLTLASEIKKNIERGEQSIIFLPRRGYSSKLICSGCGRMIVCRNCGVPMTYHKNNERLVCHYCGTSKQRPSVCPACGSPRISGRTFGTEFAEDEIERLFPGVPVVRMDSDTTRMADGHRKLLEKFEQEKVPILIGTQMVAKGLDFPNVTLVGIVNADSLMAISEYNASERAFQLLTQVTGRAGRDPKKPGRCVLQTMNPSSSVIRTASEQDYDRFAELELDYRKTLEYPPFASIANVTVSGADDKGVYENALALREAAGKIAEETFGKDSGAVELMKVTRSGLPKVDDNYFWCFTVKSQSSGNLLAVLNRLKNTVVTGAVKKNSAIKDGKQIKNFRISIDAETC